MNYANEIARMQAQRDVFKMEYDRKNAKRDLEEARRKAVSSVCWTMAQCSMTTALFATDPKVSAEAFGESMRWQYNAILASSGLPMIEKEG